jgi:integrase
MKLEKVRVLEYGSRRVIQVDTQKTGDLIDIPLHPQVITILERWKGWPKPMNPQDYNINLKKLGKLAGWTQKEYGEKVSLVKIDGKMERREKSGTYPKYELLTSHLSRRSFATNMYSVGMMSSSDIRKMTGHKTERLLEVYIHSNPKDVTNRIDDVFQSLA